MAFRIVWSSIYLAASALGVAMACSSDGGTSSSSSLDGTGGLGGSGGSAPGSGGHPDGENGSGGTTSSGGGDASGGAVGSGGNHGLGGDDGPGGLGGLGGGDDGGDGDLDGGDGDGDDGGFPCEDEQDYLSESFGEATVSWVGGARILVDDDGSVTSTTDLSYGSYAYSAQSIDAGQDGYFEFTARDATGFFGLSAGSTGSSPFEIDYAIQLWSENDVYVMEAGAQKGKRTTWQNGDVFSIHKVGSVIHYEKNGVTFYTSEDTPSDSDYHADFAYGGEGRGFDRPRLVSQNIVVSWRNVNGATVASNGSITSEVDTSYGAHAYSAQSISRFEDGYFEFTARDMRGFVGLSAEAEAAEYSEIDYALQLWSESQVYVVESGSSKGVKTTWTNGDVFRIEKQGSRVRYIKNGCTFYASMLSPGLDRYRADFAFGGAGTGFDTPILISGLPALD